MPPDTYFYMYLAFAAYLGLLGAYVISLIVRRRNLERDSATLAEMQADLDRTNSTPGWTADRGLPSTVL